MKRDERDQIGLGDGLPGSGGLAFLVADTGGNHGGQADLAERMVTAAKGAGADAVKFQAYRTEKFLSPLSPYYEELAAEELPFEVLARLGARAKKLGLAVGLTVFGPEGLDLAAEMGADFVKISSGDLSHGRLLAAAAAGGRPLFVSTGAAEEAEVEAALEILAPARGRLVLLQCAALYPAPPEAANLAVMSGWLRRGLAAGYSDHVPGLQAAQMALALGARVLEKHFTLDRGLPGGDNAISATPEEFQVLARWAAQVRLMAGEGRKRPHPLEEAMRPRIRRALVLARDLPAGHRLAEGDWELLRPAGGESLWGPEREAAVSGRRLRNGRRRGEALRADDLEPDDG